MDIVFQYLNIIQFLTVVKSIMKKINVVLQKISSKRLPKKIKKDKRIQLYYYVKRLTNKGARLVVATPKVKVITN